MKSTVCVCVCVHTRARHPVGSSGLMAELQYSKLVQFSSLHIASCCYVLLYRGPRTILLGHGPLLYQPVAKGIQIHCHHFLYSGARASLLYFDRSEFGIVLEIIPSSILLP